MDENKDKKDSFDIPSFVTKEDENIDMSVFYLDEEEQKEEPKKTKKDNKQIILIVVIAILAVLVATMGITYAYNRYEKAKEEERLRLEEIAKQEAAQKEAEKKAEEEEKLKQEEAARLEAEKKKNLGKYMIQVTVRLRQGPSTNDSLVEYEDLPDNLLELTDEALLPEGASVEVLEFKEDSTNNMKWGRIADNVWFCIQNGDDIYASKE